MTFIVSDGSLPESKLTSGVRLFSLAWGEDVVEYSASNSPVNFLKSLNEKIGLIHLLGDVAIIQEDGGSWLEALGVSKQPIIFMTSPLDSGLIPGSVAAYVALCKSLSVPLLGIIQLGGYWDSPQRRLDFLPWAGFISDSVLNNSEPKDSQNEELDLIAYNLKIRMKQLT